MTHFALQAVVASIEHLNVIEEDRVQGADGGGETKCPNDEYKYVTELVVTQAPAMITQHKKLKEHCALWF